MGKRASLVLAAAVVGGCAAGRVADPLTQSLGGNTPAAQGEFWYQLARRPVASNDEAFHALLLYLDGTDRDGSYAARVADLESRRVLPSGFDGTGDQAVERGTLAVAIDQMLHIRGGLTMRLFGPSPRYALRAAENRGLFPPSSPNQGISGGEFVGVMQKAEEYEHGNPADHPVNGPVTGLAMAGPPRHVAMLDDATAAALASAAAADSAPPAPGPPPFVPQLDPLPSPVFLDALAANAPTTAPAGGQTVHLVAIVTGIEGDLAELRPDPASPWQPAKPGMLMHEGTEIRTGPRSAVRFLIPADEAFCLDSQGAITLQQAVVNLRKAHTRIGLEHGRLREDLSHAAPVQIEQAGLAHDTVIQSPDSALALRGTKVSLFEQPSFEPVAVSLTGQAYFTNTNGMRVPFGGRHHAVIVGAETSPAQDANTRQASLASSGNTPRLEFETRELAIVSQRGGFQRGDVIVGDLHLSDFGTNPATGGPNLPGALDFVLQWTGGASQALNDLNLAVFSPLNSATNPDYVANPPFTVSLTPNSPTSVELRKSTYPQSSRSGGQISANSVGPDGLELAFWPKNYPLGTYKVVVYDLVDAVHPPPTTIDPVNYTINVYQNGVKKIETYDGTIGQLQTSPALAVPISAPTSASAVRKRSSKAKLAAVEPKTAASRRTAS